MHGRTRSLCDRPAQHELGGSHVGAPHVFGAPRVQGEDRRCVHHRVAALDRLRHHPLIEHVPHDKVGDLHPQRPQGHPHLVRPAHQETHLVSATRQRGHRVRAHKAGATRDENLHGLNHARSTSRAPRTPEADRLLDPSAGRAALSRPAAGELRNSLLRAEHREVTQSGVSKILISGDEPVGAARPAESHEVVVARVAGQSGPRRRVRVPPASSSSRPRRVQPSTREK